MQTYYAPWEPTRRFPAHVIYPRIALCRAVKLPPTVDQPTLDAAIQTATISPTKPINVSLITEHALAEWQQMTAWRPVGLNDGEPLLQAMQSGFYEYLILLGGRAGAKSHEAAEAIIEISAATPKRVVCGREFQASIRDSSRALLVQKIKQHPSVNDWTITGNELRHSNGTLITFIGMNRNPDSAKSLESCDIFWGEEAQSFSATSMEILIPTIREAGSMLLFTMNPQFADQPVYDMAMVDPPELAFIKFSAFEDNPYLFTSRLLNDLRKSFLRSKRFNHVWRGDLDRNSELRIIHHTVGEPPVKQQHMGKRLYGIDFGGTDPTALSGLIAYPPQALGREADARGALYFDREFLGITKSNRDIVLAVKETCPELITGRWILKADSADPKAIAEINYAEIPCIGAEKGAGSVVAGIRSLCDYDIYISQHCPKTINAAESYRWQADRKGNPTNVPEHKHSHIWDAARYAIEGEDLSAGGDIDYIQFDYEEYENYSHAI